MNKSFFLSGKLHRAQLDPAALLATALDNPSDEELQVAVQNGQSLQNTDALQSLLATAAEVHCNSIHYC